VQQHPLVGVIVGSRSDWATMRHAVETLEMLGVPYEAQIVSAHILGFTVWFHLSLLLRRTCMAIPNDKSWRRCSRR